jgi:uncharacterized protein YjbJ (UPF0337 family)
MERPANTGDCCHDGVWVFIVSRLAFGWSALKARRAAEANIQRLKGASMRQSKKDESAGKMHEVKGKVKEKVGRAIGNPGLEDEGTDEKVAGKIQKKVGQIERVLED